MARPSPAAPSAAMVTRSATARPDQEFAVAVSAGDRRGHDADARPVQVAIEPLGDVGGEARVKWAVADVDGIDAFRAPREEHLGEAAGRGADVERSDAVHGEAERVEGGNELEGCAGNIFRRGIVERDGGIWRYRQCRTRGGLAIDRDPA